MKYFLLFIFIIVFLLMSTAQVYVYGAHNNVILLGPENISKYDFLLSQSYIDELNSIKSELKNNGKENIFIDSLLNSWYEVIRIQESLLEASELIKRGSCIEFETENSVFYSDELTIEVANLSGEIKYKEFFNVKINSGAKWVKRKSTNNCLSPNPEDCMIWCLEESNKYIIEDFSGKEHFFETCPSGFMYDEFNNHCYQKYTYLIDNEKEVIVLKYNRKIIKPISWQLIECR